MEEFTETFFLRLVLEKVNRLAADVVLLTGDFASRGPFGHNMSVQAAARCGEMLGKYLACRERYAVLGNHDNIIGAHFVLDALAQARIPVLVNRHLPIERGGHHLWLAGVDDPGTGHPNLDLALPDSPDAPVILMSHAPDFTDEVVSHRLGQGVALVISGHTHGGQVRLPLLGPMVLPLGGRKYIHGLFHFGKLQLYVNRGIGTVGMPIRFDCRPEITLLTLQPQA
jgi:predicted MPP superfamily phosphohydrolase